MTYEEFLSAFGEDDYVEWVDGEVVRMSPVSLRHQEIAQFVLRVLLQFVEAKPLGRVLSAPFQMKTGPSLAGREPDVLYVSNERAANLKSSYLDGPADIAVEVISPESRARDRGEKFYEYEQGGVREYWLIDPMRKQAEFYRLGADGVYRVAAPTPDGRFQSEALPGFWLQVDWLWQEPLPPVLAIVREWGLL